jgi:hypothetical protein
MRATKLPPTTTQHLTVKMGLRQTEHGQWAKWTSSQQTKQVHSVPSISQPTQGHSKMLHWQLRSQPITEHMQAHQEILVCRQQQLRCRPSKQH